MYVTYTYVYHMYPYDIYNLSPHPRNGTHIGLDLWISLFRSTRFVLLSRASGCERQRRQSCMEDQSLGVMEEHRAHRAPYLEAGVRHSAITNQPIIHSSAHHVPKFA